MRATPTGPIAINALGTRHVAEAARRVGAHVVYVSTDYVFDGTSPRPYVEWDPPNPMSVYGASKLGGEHELDPGSTVVRTSWVCGAHGANMVRTVLRLAGQPGPLRFVDDQRGSPTFTADLAGALAVLGTERLPGIFHVTNPGVTSWYGFARAVLEAAGHDPTRVEPIATAELDPPRPAPRPANSALDNAALRLMGMALLPDWRDGLERLVAATEPGPGIGEGGTVTLQRTEPHEVTTAVIGAGYVGLTTAVVLTHLGYQVVCGESNPAKVEQLSRGEPTIVEEGLGDILIGGLDSGRLQFVLGATEAVRGRGLRLPVRPHAPGRRRGRRCELPRGRRASRSRRISSTGPSS